MNENIERLKVEIEPFRQQIIQHKVYAAIKSDSHLRIFMQHHVFAVWDFMSLLKALQNNLTCTTVPWFPKGDAKIRYLINEIVTGEEADIDENGIHKSHFELYIDAMQQCGADTDAIFQFTQALQKNFDLEAAYFLSKANAAVQGFVNQTFDIIESNKSHVQAAAFTFGREDLIPAMFIAVINDIHKTFPGSFSIFEYYLQRHIELDGDKHSHLALEMTANLCGNSAQNWAEAKQAVIASLQKRIALWDAVYDRIIETKKGE